MKRMIALTLCLVMVLGLFTGITAATGATIEHKLVFQDASGNTPPSFVSDITAPVGGSMGINLAIQDGDGALTPLPKDAEIIFLTADGTQAAGTICYREQTFGPDTTYWCWYTNECAPNQTATLQAIVTVNGVPTTYVSDKTYSTRPWPISIYADKNCTQYVTENQRTLVYSGTAPICYLKVESGYQMPAVSNNCFTVTAVANTTDLYQVTATAGLTGAHSVTFVAADNNGNHYQCEATFTDGKNLTILRDDGRIFDSTQIAPIGNEGINLTYGLSNTPVPSDATVVFKDSKGNTTSSLGTIFYDPGSNEYGSWTWRWNRNSVIPNTSGTMEVTIDDTTYSCQVNYIMPALAFYSQEACSLSSYIPFSDLFNLTYSSTNMPNLYIQTHNGWYINSYESDNPNIIVKEIPDKHVLQLKQGTTGEQAGDIQFHLTNGNGGNHYYGVGFRFINRGSLAQTKAEVSQWTDRTPADNRHEIASVTYEGNTYYLVLANGTDGTIIMNPMHSTGLGLDDKVICDYYVDFCTKSEELNRYQRVDAELSKALFDRFINGSKTGPSALVFEILPINYTFLDPDEYTKPTYTPAVYYGPENWPISYQAVYDWDCGGEFLIRISGFYTNDDGTTKFCETYATEGIYPIVHDEVSFTTIADAQDYLNNYRQNTASDMLAIRFNVAELEGHLVIPDNLHNIALHGGYTDENGEWQKTIWRGGVSSGADFGTHLQFFHFIGAGGEDANIKDIPQYWPGTNIPNYAIYGSANGVTHHCTIEGYYYGLYMDKNSTSTHLGGEATTYYRNVTAVYADVPPNGGGWIGNSDCTFEENGTAMDFVSFPAGGLFNMSKVEILRARFINNDVDIRNQTGQILWMPLNYFVHDKQFENCNDINNAEKKRTPILEGSVTSNKKDISTIIPYPMAWDESFDAQQYYYPKKYTTQNDLARMYPYVSFKDRSKEMQRVMPLSDEASEETVTVDSLSGEKWVATMEVTSPTTTPVTYSLRSRLRAAPQMVYIMERGVLESGVVAVDLPGIPDTSTGTAQTWVDESWLSVKVTTADGVVLDSSVNDGIVTFDLQSGYYAQSDRAFYFIEPTATVEASSDQKNMTVTVEHTPEAKHVMLAAYDSNDQMLWVSPGTIGEDGNVILPCEDFANVKTITFFFLDVNYAPTGQSATRTIS